MDYYSIGWRDNTDGQGQAYHDATDRENNTPMNTQQQAKHTPAMTLDTFEADLLNESTSRRETVTEIQTEDGALLCYAEPTQAARLAHCWNNHNALLEALQATLTKLDHALGTDCECDNTTESNRTTCIQCMARAAIQAATTNP